MRSTPAALCGAVLLLTVAAPAARAEPINWSYSWSNSPTNVTSDSDPGSYVHLTNEKLTKAVNSSDIVATNLTTFSQADPDHPAQFTHRTYKLTLTLIDQDSNKSATVTFAGEFNGRLTSLSSNLSNTFLGATSFSVVLGKHRYVVTMDSYSPPGPPGAHNAGSIAAHADINVGLVNTPEPASLTLLVLGVALVSFAPRGRRRSRSPA